MANFQILLQNSIVKRPKMSRNDMYDKVRQKFTTKGYGNGTYITNIQYTRILNELMPKGETFNEEVANQIWNQAQSQGRASKYNRTEIANSQNLSEKTKDLQVSTVCQTIIDAHNILKSKIQQVGSRIQEIQTYKRKNNAGSLSHSSEIENQLNELYEYKQSYEEDLKQLAQPFNLERIATQSKASLPAEKQSEELRMVFYMVLAYTFLEIILVFGKPDFLNLIVATCMLSLYLLNFFDKVYIRFVIILTGISIILDIVWIILYAKNKWNPDIVANQSVYMIGYWRFVVFFTLALIPLKAALAFFLFKYRNTEKEQRYVVELGIIKLMLNQNRNNPISKQLETKKILTTILS